MDKINIQNPQLNPMKPNPLIYDLDRDINLIEKLTSFFNLSHIVYLGNSTYIPVNLALFYNNLNNKNITIVTSPDLIVRNNNITNDFTDIPIKSIIYYNLENKDNENNLLNNYDCSVLITNTFFETDKYIPFVYPSNIYESKFILIKNEYVSTFKHFFEKYIIDSTFAYDNLIHLTMIVKNAGEQFREVLQHNLPYIDEWTILDTGSTDNTIDIIKDVLKNKKGTLYQEPFINFRDSRNRCLDLAGESCVFTIMLDDTYLLNGDVRKFLTIARTDDFAESYSCYIKTDIQYVSNRIIWSKSKHREKNLRYMYKIHEVIETNRSLLIPNDFVYITENINDINNQKYMMERTNLRKDSDLQLLFEENKEHPEEPRHYYYIAETYLCKEQWKEAYEWYEKRSKIPSKLVEETYDSLYKMTVIADLNLKYDWSIVENLYLKCALFQKRPEAFYMIGSHYLKENNFNMAFKFLKEAFLNINNIHEYQMNYKINMYNNYITHDLIPLCLNNVQLGLNACIHAIKNSNIPDFVDKAKIWYNIYFKILNASKYIFEKKINFSTANNNKLICFVMEGGWNKWDATTLITKGLGGSETFIVNYAKELYNIGYNIIVFCNCDNKVCDGVIYMNINLYNQFSAKYIIDYCLLNRCPENLGINYLNKIPTYLILHDLFRNNEIIIDNPLLLGILCISDWHSGYIKNLFPHFSEKIKTISYGIDNTLYNNDTEKIPYSFIYSSFPNRGLVHLLKIFPKIVEKYPQAILNLFCDIKHKFVQDNCKEEMDEIEKYINHPNITNHGWVSGDILRNWWDKSYIWLYPCTFVETCCLTAYECASSRTLAITNNLAALKDSVGDRGIIFNNQIGTIEWQKEILDIISDVFDKKIDINSYLDKNIQWVLNKKYNIVVEDFEKRFIL